MIDSFTDGYRFLSNFWYVEVMDDFLLPYASVEHAYQAQKTTAAAQRILLIEKCKTPSQAKAYGKMLPLRSDWNKIRRKIMLDLTRQKYNNNKLKMLLLGTGTQKLVEGNLWHDNYWGVCSCQSCIVERREKCIKGENWLGKIIMLVRMEIQIKEGL